MYEMIGEFLTYSIFTVLFFGIIGILIYAVLEALRNKNENPIKISEENLNYCIELIWNNETNGHFEYKYDFRDLRPIYKLSDNLNSLIFEECKKNVQFVDRKAFLTPEIIAKTISELSEKYPFIKGLRDDALFKN